MKRLFAVRNVSGKLATRNQLLDDGDNTPYYFEQKAGAKLCRNELGEGWHVTRGPDHMGKHSGYPVPRMRRKPR